VGVEALHDDRDLRMVIKREQFTDMAKERGLWERLLPPIEQAIAMANLTKEDIHRVEVIGGATRIPAVQQTAKDFFGRKTLDGALNGDEAGALGATLFAAKSATQFRLREFTINDAFPFASSVRITGQADEAKEEAAAEGEEGAADSKKGKDKLLFKAMTKMPHKKVIKSTRTDDILVHLSVGDANAGEKLEPMSVFNITNVAAAYERMLKDDTREVVGKPSVAITFSLSSSGLIDVTKAEMTIETKEWETVMVPANVTDEDSNSTEAEAEVEVDANTTDGEGANGTNATAAKPVKMVPEKRQKKGIRVITLKWTQEVLGVCTPLSSEEVNKCIKRNADMLIEEKRRRLNAEAKNGLESFIIDTRDKIGDESMDAVSTEEERQSLRDQFNELEDWLYGDGMSLDAKEYNKRKKDLMGLTQPIFLRFSEMTDRPAAVEAAREAVNWTLSILDKWATEDNKAVTPEERAKVAEMCTNFTEWLDAAEAEQALLSPTDKPAFLSSAVAQGGPKLGPIETEIRKLIKRPQPKPPKVKKNETGAANGTVPNATDANATAPEGQEEEAAKEEAKPAEGEEDELPKHDEL